MSSLTYCIEATILSREVYCVEIRSSYLLMGIREATRDERIKNEIVFVAFQSFISLRVCSFLLWQSVVNRLLGMVTRACPTTFQQKAVSSDVDRARATSRVSVSMEYFLLQCGHYMSLLAN